MRPPVQCLTHQAVCMSSSMSCQSAAGAADEVFRRTSRQRKQPTRSSLRIPWRTFIHVQWRRARRWSTILRWESKVLSAFAWHARSADRVKDAMFRERTELPQPDDADGTYDHGQWTATGNSMLFNQRGAYAITMHLAPTDEPKMRDDCVHKTQVQRIVPNGECTAAVARRRQSASLLHAA